MRRTAILLAGIAVLALLLTPATGTATSRGAPGVAAQQQPSDSPALNARGLQLYQAQDPRHARQVVVQAVRQLT